MIERSFDVAFVAAQALREKQIQQNYRPVIAVHKWFARRPGTLFRALILSEFAQQPLAEAFFGSHDFAGIQVADPFMGGGTPLIEANRVGCDVLGLDINPMAHWIVREEIQDIDIEAYARAVRQLSTWLKQRIGDSYLTTCLLCGHPEAPVKYFLWVKQAVCEACKRPFDLFPGYLLSEDKRHPRNVVICAECGNLNEIVSTREPGSCSTCHAILHISGPARRGRCACPHCATVATIPPKNPRLFEHRMVAIEYHCPVCKPHHAGRFFKAPDPADIQRYQDAAGSFRRLTPRFVPDDAIPPGDETDRLLRWGYRRYRELFNERQLLGLELSCRGVEKHPDERIRSALATNLSDLLRYQNMLCRYDTMALKSLDVFSVHGFPVGLVQCESNMLGIPSETSGANVGSGGWSNISTKYLKAKEYCSKPYEISHQGARKRVIPTPGETIGANTASNGARRKHIELRCEDSALVQVAPQSLDAVFTDPPYFANVQYAELMDFCYVWLRKLAPHRPEFASPSTRNVSELTGNVTMDRGVEHFTQGLSATFCRMRDALKPGSPLVFTYHHNSLSAYFPLAVAILDAKLACTASLACPAEMGASIHINGTGSSIVDTVFVCRSTGSMLRRWIEHTSEGLARLVLQDRDELRKSGFEPTKGDLRCISYGHSIRMAIWQLRSEWEQDLAVSAKLELVRCTAENLGGARTIDIITASLDEPPAGRQNWTALEGHVDYDWPADEITF